MNINPNALLLVGIATLIGYLFGAVLIGLLIGLLIVAVSTFTS